MEELSLYILTGGFVGFAVAVLAGFITFFTPCVLPIVPPYLAYMSGLSLQAIQGETASKGQWQKMLPAALFFVLGFGLVFIALGMAFTSFTQMLREFIAPMRSIAGYFIFFMGLIMLKPALLTGWKKSLVGLIAALVMVLGILGIFGIVSQVYAWMLPAVITALLLWIAGFFSLPFLYQEMRFKAGDSRAFIGPFLMGIAFSFGWTACTGPLLASVLLVTGEFTSTPIQGAFIMLGFTLGLAIPFVLSALLTGTMLGFMSTIKRYLSLIEYVTALMLLLAGLLMLSGAFTFLALWLEQYLPAF